MQGFKNLRAWGEWLESARTGAQLPCSEERFGLANQMRRASYSIPSNIAEVFGRGSDRDFRRFLRMAYGSACELETQACSPVSSSASTDRLAHVESGKRKAFQTSGIQIRYPFRI